MSGVLERPYAFRVIFISMARPKTRTGICTKCMEREAKPGQSWCNECFRIYQAERAESLRTLDYSRGFADGAEAMAGTVTVEFRRFSSVTVTMDEAARFVESAPRPKPKS